jgi:energy-coupling factor transporter ATP-binding protein EcfA2
MPAKASILSIVGFRGATSLANIPLDVSKAITVIFGENGTGKSTIADAFDFVCNRAYGSLENFSIGESAKKHLASLNSKPVDIKVGLTCGTSTWTATLGKEGPRVTPPTGCPDARILRRKRILDLIEEQPKKRFEALKAFIAVPGIEKSENALRESVKTTDTNYNEAVRAYTQAREALEKLWAVEDKPGKSALEWARKEVQKNSALLQNNITETDSIEKAFESAHAALNSLNDSQLALKNAKESHIQAEDKQKEAEKKQTQQNSQLVKLLQDAKEYINKKKPLDNCPVCEQKIDSEKLLLRLDERVKEMSELVSLISFTSKAKGSADEKKLLADEARKKFCQKTKELCSAVKASSLAEVKALDIDWATFETLLSYEEPSEEVEQDGRNLLTVTTPCREPLQKRKKIDQKSFNHHNAVKGYFDTITDKFIYAKTLERLFKKLKGALDIVSQQRKNYVEEVLGSIATEVESLYIKLHPGEGIGKIRFFLKPNAIGSLEFDGQFFDTCELPPQAYYSESHLDTLGICVFLALTKRFKTENTIVILDDVVTSVDGPHLDRFMKLLHDEAKNFNQVIITTHYRPWRDRYRWAKGPTSNTQIIELGPWTLREGLQTGEFVTAIEELGKAIAEATFDRQVVTSKAGIILESILDFLTLKFRCRIPRNSRNEYTLGDLASGIDSKLGKELKNRKSPISGGTKIEKSLKALIDECTREQWIRNSVGCHFSSLGSEVTDNEIREFSQNVLALSDELICGECGTLPTRRPSGSYWECKCGKLELHPLIYPGADPTTVDDEG